MNGVATHYTESVQAVLTANSVPWSISQLGARAEYRFTRRHR
jgi:glutamate-1-semialdehyde 2,1-aminomutase